VLSGRSSTRKTSRFVQALSQNAVGADATKQPYIELAAKDKTRAEEEKASMAAVCTPYYPPSWHVLNIFLQTKSSAKEKSDGEEQADEEED
jgi:hypothetical protein